MFIAKLRGRCRDFQDAPCSYIWSVSLIINIHHQSGTFVIIDEPTLAHHNPPKSIVDSRVHAWCCTSIGLDKCIITHIHHCGITEYFLLPPKPVLLHFILHIQPLANTYLFGVSIVSTFSILSCS